VSDYGDAVRDVLGEAELVCPCGAMNSPTHRIIRIDINGVAYCRDCGRGGEVKLFQLKEKRT
jgi:arylamine N-acetyltransferase